MNPFTVTWEQEAFDALAELWMGASDRQAIAASCDAIDAFLKASPYAGQHLREGLYKLASRPLKVTYSVEDEDRLVVVQSVNLAT